MEMEFHKYSNIFPMIDGEKLQELKRDIKENGLLQPIILYENKILDGRNRYNACKELGIKPEFKNYDGNKPLEFVISLNLKRRHLTADQRAVIAQEVMPMLQEEARKRQATSTGGRTPHLREIVPKAEKGRPSEHAGKMFDVNEKYVRDIKKLKDAGRDREIEEIKTGKKKISWY